MIKYHICCVVASEFGKIECNYMIISLQDYTSLDKSSRIEQLHNIRVKRVATAMHQTAEWGMHGLQASFPQ